MCGWSWRPAPVPKGGSDNRPFSVVAVADDGREIEASGSLELSSRPDAIGSAQLYVHPGAPADQGTQGDLCGRRRQPTGRRAAAGAAHRRGRVRPGPGHLQATGAARAPGAGRAGEPPSSRTPRPEGGSSSTRRVQITATSASGTISGEATFTQKAAPATAGCGRCCWCCSGLLTLAIGAFIWASDDGLSGDAVPDAADRLISAATDGRHARDLRHPDRGHRGPARPDRTQP